MEQTQFAKTALLNPDQMPTTLSVFLTYLVTKTLLSTTTEHVNNVQISLKSMKIKLFVNLQFAHMRIKSLRKMELARIAVSGPILL